MSKKIRYLVSTSCLLLICFSLFILISNLENEKLIADTLDPGQKSNIKGEDYVLQELKKLYRGIEGETVTYYGEDVTGKLKLEQEWRTISEWRQSRGEISGLSEEKINEYKNYDKTFLKGLADQGDLYAKWALANKDLREKDINLKKSVDR